MEKTIDALVIKPEEKPELKKIGSGLEELQAQVGGLIQVVYPFEDEIGLIMNEEGKINNLPLNRGLFDDEGHLYDIIAGTFLVVGLTDEGFGSLTQNQIEKYSAMYEKPQTFIKLGREIIAVPFEKVEELVEDDYDMIDGIINNGEKKTSVMDKLQEKKKEVVEAESSRTKFPQKENQHNIDLS